MARPRTCHKSRSPKQRITAVKILAIQSGEARVIVDRYGRVHTPLTNLRRVVRPALRIHGQELVEVDVSNAQPLLLGFIVAKFFAGDWSLAQIKRLGSACDLSDPFNGMGFTRWSTNLPPDLRDYLETCERGEFYGALADAWGLPCQSPKEKNEIKRLVFKHVLFGRVRQGKRHWEAFRRLWPSVAIALQLIKHGDHGTSARACQRIESQLMISGVVQRFLREHPDQLIQTIHDSVLVLPEAVEIAKGAILKEFAIIGLTPSIKEKDRTKAGRAKQSRQSAGKPSK